MIRFLIKWILFLFLFLILISFFVSKEEKFQNKNLTSSLSTEKAASAIETTISDLKKFCERNETTCKVGTDFYHFLVTRVKIGAKAIYEYLDLEFSNEQPKQ